MWHEDFPLRRHHSCFSKDNEGSPGGQIQLLVQIRSPLNILLLSRTRLFSWAADTFFFLSLSSSLSPPLPICHLQFPLHKSHCCGKHCQTVGMILSSQKVRKRAQEGGVKGRRCLTLSFGLFAINPTWSLCDNNNWSRSKLAHIAKSSSKQAVCLLLLLNTNCISLVMTSLYTPSAVRNKQKINLTLWPIRERHSVRHSVGEKHTQGEDQVPVLLQPGVILNCTSTDHSFL